MPDADRAGRDNAVRTPVPSPGYARHEGDILDWTEHWRDRRPGGCLRIVAVCRRAPGMTMRHGHAVRACSGQ